MDGFCYSTVDGNGNTVPQQMVAYDMCNFLYYRNEVGLSSLLFFPFPRPQVANIPLCTEMQEQSLHQPPPS